MKHFEPTRPDGRSFRDVAVEAFKEKAPGEVVSYAALAEALELDPDLDRKKIQTAVRAANKVLLALHQRGLANAPKSGYRVLQAREHVVLASGYQNKADRAMQRAVDVYKGTDLSQLTDVERRLHENQHMLAVALVESHRHLDRRIKKIEDLLRGSSPTIAPE